MANICCWPGCDREVQVKIKGMCHKHYKKDRYPCPPPKPPLTEEERRIRRKEKAKEWRRSDLPADARRSAGYRARHAEELRIRRKLRADVTYDKKVKKLYGVTAVEVARLIVEQSHECAVCGAPLGEKGPSSLAPVIDHCHRSGKVRGILHRKCNSVLGLVKESEETLAKMAEYLRKHAA